ncbi:MAG: hypothetical protein JG765_2002 [Cereibacter sp.]|jgi:hypothetical protein|nr:hypothetical protein [Cereibacter sp.]
MSLLRPEARAALHRWREVIAAGAAALAGLWLIRLGGWFLIPLGVLVIGLCAVWAVMAWRRMQFAQEVQAPGVVEVDEGQVGYMGPTFGGYVALEELQELRLLTLHGQRMWRLKQSDGQLLLIPVAAQGAERLFDAFGALPGMDTQTLVAALAPPKGASAARGLSLSSETGQIGPVIWRRPLRAVLT